MARARGKLAALTETGVEAVPDPKWWTGTLLPALREAGPGISYALVWRNANPASDRKGHFYAPYAGQASAADFVAFKNAPDVLFEDELPKLYRRP
jgi:mannan endo-1,4-beta-mannosidase